MPTRVTRVDQIVAGSICILIDFGRKLWNKKEITILNGNIRTLRIRTNKIIKIMRISTRNQMMKLIGSPPKIEPVSVLIWSTLQ